MNTLDLLDRPIAFHRVFVTITGSINAALMLSQAIYWSKRTRDEGGWFYKSALEWCEETGLTRHMQDAARELLKDVLETKLAGMPATVHFRVSAENLRTWLAKNGKQDCRKPANKPAEIRQPTNRTENTTESTPVARKTRDTYTLQSDPLALEFGAIYGRRPTTQWSPKEMKAWKAAHKAGLLTPESVARYAWFYRKCHNAQRPPYPRTTIQIALNNWGGECDKAAVFCKKTPIPKTKSAGASNGSNPPPAAHDNSPEAMAERRAMIDKAKSDAGLPVRRKSTSVDAQSQV
jgi:hypothetical protein